MGKIFGPFISKYHSFENYIEQTETLENFNHVLLISEKEAKVIEKE